MEVVSDYYIGNSYCKNRPEKAKETKEKIVMQNASICTVIKIGSIFWLFILKKDKPISLLVIEIHDAKIANI